jgi:hypothetical protein
MAIMAGCFLEVNQRTTTEKRSRIVGFALAMTTPGPATKNYISADTNANM